MTTSVKYQYTFIAGAFTDTEIVMNNFVLDLHFFIETDSEVDRTVAFDRMDFFINQIVSNATFVNSLDTVTVNRLSDAELKLLLVHEHGPTDQIILLTLVSKLIAITAERISIVEAELSSLNDKKVKGYNIRYLYHPFENENDNLIGNNKADWWNSEALKFQNTSVSNSQIHKFDKTATWKDLNLHWEEDEDADGEFDIKFSPTTTTDNIVMLNKNDKEEG